MAETWLSTTDMATELGVSAKFLRENRTNLFEPVDHYRLKNPNAYRPTYVWHRLKCQAVIDQATKEATALEENQIAAGKGRGVQLPFVPGIQPKEIN